MPIILDMSMKNIENITVRIITILEGTSQLVGDSWFACLSFHIWLLVEGTSSKSLDRSTNGPGVLDSGWYGFLYSFVSRIAWAPVSQTQMSQERIF
jgi:hypothetical protein